MNTVPLIIIDAGADGLEFIWVAEEMNSAAGRIRDVAPWKILGFVNNAQAGKGQRVAGWPVLGTIEEASETFRHQSIHFAVSAGDNAVRERLAIRAGKLNWHAAKLVHPSALIPGSVMVGEGSYIGAGCVISLGAKVGNHVIVNLCASIGHDGVLGDYSQIGSGARVNGGCKVGRRALLGSNASLAPGVEVGDSAVVRANSFAAKKVARGIIVAASPAARSGKAPRKAAKASAGRT